MINNNKKINKKNNTNKNVLGGKVLASGGFGCVFTPALKCQGESRRTIGKISKLMTEKHAIEEYEEINIVKERLSSIRNYQDLFLLYDATLCKPAKLSSSDLIEYTKKCKALPKDDITKKNINKKLDKLMLLNMPNGGLPIDNYLYSDGSLKKIYNVHLSLLKLLKEGIVPMNKKNVYHCDIKDSNVLVDVSREKLKTRLIDWGLSTEYTPFKQDSFPKPWRNRPLQFNVPFSVIIFSESFIEKYSQFIQEEGVPDEIQLKPFVINYINSWMKERGSGHYKFINEIMFKLFSNSLTTISEDLKPKVVETQITMSYIVNYIIDVLVHFTKFREDGTLNLREYLDNVFIQIVDIWGFITVYFPILEILSNNYSSLTKNELKVFNQLQFIFVEYLYNPRHEPINMNQLYSDLKKLGNLLYFTINKVNNRNVSIKKSYNSYDNANGIYRKTKRNYIKEKNLHKISFKRRPNQRRFKNPIF
jgi:serine/threonine protein kinase